MSSLSANTYDEAYELSRDSTIHFVKLPPVPLKSLFVFSFRGVWTSSQDIRVHLEDGWVDVPGGFLYPYRPMSFFRNISEKTMDEIVTPIVLSPKFEKIVFSLDGPALFSNNGTLITEIKTMHVNKKL